MSEKYIPSSEELAEAEGFMSRVQELISEDRAIAYEDLTDVDKEVLNNCDLKYSNGTDNNIEITGTIKGRQVFLRIKDRFGSKPGEAALFEVSGELDGGKLSVPQVMELIFKYRRIAKFQTINNTNVENRTKYEQKVVKEDLDKAVGDLLS